MGLGSALNAAVSGLRTTQAGIDLVSQNIANSGSAGYTKRRMTTIQTVAADRTQGVRAGAIERVLDEVTQRQLRLETSGAAYTSVAARFAAAVGQLFGEPGSNTALDGTLNSFTQSLQRLAANPGDYATRGAALETGRALADRIATIAAGVQGLRTEAEGRIGAAVQRANELLSGIQVTNARVVAAHDDGAGSAALLDERDRLVNELSGLLDLKVMPGDGGSIRLTTLAGQTLFDGNTALKLTFDGRGTLGPNSLYATDDAKRGVGTIKAVGPNGSSIDLLAQGLIRSGEIAAAVEMRDETLVAAQRQLDELAAGLSRALSDRQAPVTDVSTAVQSGYEIDLTGWQPGNALTIRYTDGGTPRTLLLVPTNGSAPNPIPPAETGDPNATVIAVPMSASFSTMAASIQAELTARGIPLGVTSPAAGTFRIVDDGPAGRTDVTGLSAGVTVTGFESGAPQLPFFVDAGFGNTPFTGSFDGGSHLTGLAQRLKVNPALVQDRSRLVVYNASPRTPDGDGTRPQFILDALTKTSRSFSAASGIGGMGGPQVATVADYARTIVGVQGENAATASRLDEGQQVALKNVEARFAETSAVNIDEEMSQLVQLQTAYGANARVMTAVKEMLDMLLRI